jgi:hypothetical protein
MHGPQSERDWEATWPWVVGFAAFTVAMRVAARLLVKDPLAFAFWNFMPVGALGLFAGARYRSWQAYLVPLAAMLASDLLLIKPLADQGFAAFGKLTPVIYLSFGLNVLIGRLMRPTSSFLWIAPLAVLTSLQFFLTSNFAVWALGDGSLYPHNFAGLVMCYTAAVPFYNSLAADLLYSAAFFGLHSLAVYLTLPHQKASQPA